MRDSLAIKAMQKKKTFKKILLKHPRRRAAIGQYRNVTMGGPS